MLAQRLLREDCAIGMFRLGLSAELADLLSGADARASRQARVVGQNLLCAFRFNDHSMLSALTQPAKNEDIAPMHAAILLAGQPAEQFA